MAASPGALIPDPTGLVLVPTFGALAIGLVLVIVGGWLLGNYITRPINNLEEGLLAILNGQADKRFELDHAELGGLAFRIDQLLNQLMGVEEDPTDDEGRVSRSPGAAANFTDSLEVDDKKMTPGPRAPSIPTSPAAWRPSRRRSTTPAFTASTSRPSGPSASRRITSANRPSRHASRAWSKTRLRSTAGRCATRSTGGTKRSFFLRSRCRKSAVC